MKVCINSSIKSSAKRVIHNTCNKAMNFCTISPKFQERDTWECSMSLGQVIHTGCISSKNYAKGANVIGDIIPNSYITDGKWSDHYYIDKIFGDGNGAGTQQVQKVVLNSLKDTQTRGRVLLEAACIDGGKTHPAGFYYKLGFRHTCKDCNLKLDKWLKAGGKKENAPWCSGNMYLAQENIMQCLNYGNTTYSLKDRLLIKCYILRNKILFAIDNLKKAGKLSETQQ